MLSRRGPVNEAGSSLPYLDIVIPAINRFTPESYVILRLDHILLPLPNRH